MRRRLDPVLICLLVCVLYSYFFPIFICSCHWFRANICHAMLAAGKRYDSCCLQAGACTTVCHLHCVLSKWLERWPTATNPRRPITVRSHACRHPRVRP
jgi:hypothetical protein